MSSTPTGMLRTPDDRFANLPEFSFRPRYAELEGGRTHYVDEGRGQAVLCVHGSPAWSFLYRKVIPNLAWQVRVVVPDLIGFGRSDKYAPPGACSLSAHAAQLADLVRKLDLRDVTFVGHGWGALAGAALVAADPARFFRLVLIDPLPADEAELAAARPAAAGSTAPIFEASVGAFLREHCPEMPPEAAAAYDAPFPDAAHRTALRSAPPLVPTPGLPGSDELARARDGLAAWFKPALVLRSDRDPAPRAWASRACALLPGAQAAVPIEGTGHFLLEERGEDVADRIRSFILRNPPPRAATTFRPTSFW